MRRGALLAFEAMADAFGDKLWDAVPQVWAGLSKALLGESWLAFLTAADGTGQPVIDALVSIRLLAPHLSAELLPRVQDLLPAVINANQDGVALVRNQAAQCLATICTVMTDTAMRIVIDSVVPLVGDARLHARQGSLEAIHRELTLEKAK